MMTITCRKHVPICIRGYEKASHVQTPVLVIEKPSHPFTRQQPHRGQPNAEIVKIICPVAYALADVLSDSGSAFPSGSRAACSAQSINGCISKIAPFPRKQSSVRFPPGRITTSVPLRNFSPSHGYEPTRSPMFRCPSAAVRTHPPPPATCTRTGIHRPYQIVRIVRSPHIR